MVVRNSSMHDGAVDVTLDVRLEPVKGVAPSYLAHLIGGHRPLTEACEMHTEAFRDAGRCEIQKGVAKTQAPAEINGDIKEVETAQVALGIQQVHQHVACVAIGDIAHHHGAVHRAWQCIAPLIRWSPWCHFGRRSPTPRRWSGRSFRVNI